MSAYKVYQTAFTKKYQDILVDSLKDIGYKIVESHTEPKQLRGYRGDKRIQKAHVIVRGECIGNGSNDVGWEFQTDGTCIAHISDYDSSVTFYTEKQTELNQKYSENFVKNVAKQQGWDVENLHVEADGSIELELTQMLWQN